jgi:hypothetical protein
MSLKEFREFCKMAWKDDYGFVYIDLSKTKRVYKTKRDLTV